MKSSIKVRFCSILFYFKVIFDHFFGQNAFYGIAEHFFNARKYFFMRGQEEKKRFHGKMSKNHHFSRGKCRIKITFLRKKNLDSYFFD